MTITDQQMDQLQLQPRDTQPARNYTLSPNFNYTVEALQRDMRGTATFSH